jgi:hypothetical protein
VQSTLSIPFSLKPAKERARIGTEIPQRSRFEPRAMYPLHGHGVEYYPYVEEKSLDVRKAHRADHTMERNILGHN